MTSENDHPTPGQQVAALYEQVEAQAAQAGEHLVASSGFARLLGQMAENAAAVTKLGGDAMDVVLRNFRLAGRRDVVRLSRQLARTEDKLERVLQELEELRNETVRADRDGAGSAGGRQTRRTNGSSARQRKEST